MVVLYRKHKFVVYPFRLLFTRNMYISRRSGSTAIFQCLPSFIACSSLTLTSALGMDDLQAVQNPGGRSAYSSNSLLNCIIKLCQRQVTASNPQILKSAFGVIATCVMSQECRGVLWKV